MDELAFYRQHSPLTDPGEHRTRLGELPADVAVLGALVRGVLVHRDETAWLHGFDLPPSDHLRPPAALLTGPS